MPLEVHEIGITMQVGEPAADLQRPGEAVDRDKDAREELIEECVRRVLDALRAERER